MLCFWYSTSNIILSSRSFPCVFVSLFEFPFKMMRFQCEKRTDERTWKDPSERIIVIAILMDVVWAKVWLCIEMGWLMEFRSLLFKDAEVDEWEWSWATTAWGAVGWRHDARKWSDGDGSRSEVKQPRNILVCQFKQQANCLLVCQYYFSFELPRLWSFIPSRYICPV